MGSRRGAAAAAGLLCGWLLSLTLPAGAAGKAPEDRDRLAAISIIIDDMGNNAGWGERALRIPGAVTYAMLPHTPHARALANRAQALGKEVMLHLPLESTEGNALGPGALTLHQTNGEFLRTLRDDLTAVPHIRGVNNHMGSLLTQHPGAMEWLMQGLSTQPDLFFIDSRTSSATVAAQLAAEHGIPYASRDLFLDNDRDPAAIRRQMLLLFLRARQQGFAIGIGHPYPETSQVLSEMLANPGRWQVRLIPASEMIQLQGSKRSWQKSSSPSPKVAKRLRRSP